jgi:hypothetical protein
VVHRGAPKARRGLPSAPPTHMDSLYSYSYAKLIFGSVIWADILIMRRRAASCMDTHTYTHTHAHTHTHRHTYIHTRTYTRTHTHTLHVSRDYEDDEMGAYSGVCVCVCVCVFVCECVHVYVRQLRSHLHPFKQHSVSVLQCTTYRYMGRVLST